MPLLPEQLDFDAVLYPEVRYRGLHRFPVYRADLRISGTITLPEPEGLRVRAETLDWAGAFVALAVTDARAVASSLLMGIVLGALYAFLYLVLRAEDYAMLAGALGLWVVLATIMYLTRRIDWYGPRGEG